MVWGIVIGIILFLVLLAFEAVYLSNHFRAKRAKQDAAGHHYDRVWYGRSGSGYVAASGKQVIVFKTPTKQATFQLGKLYVFTSKRRVDFNETYAPLTVHQKLFGVFLSDADYTDLMAWFADHHVLVTPEAQVLQEAQAILDEEAKKK